MVFPFPMDSPSAVPVINAWGTITTIGGSRMSPAVLEAMTSASHHFTDMRLLLADAGRAVAAVMGAQAVCLVSGASAGLTVATAACMAGDDELRIAQLPDTEGLRNEVIILAAHRTPYEQAIRLAGATLVEVGSAQSADVAQVLAAVSERTALFFYLAEAAGEPGSIALKDVVGALRPLGIPIVVDAAAELPPTSHFHAFTDAGADLVIFSGGKEIAGPQSSGIIAGRGDLVRYCVANAFPNMGVGRGMKLDKETIVGLVTAVQLFAAHDAAQTERIREAIVSELATALAEFDDPTVRSGRPVTREIQPAVIPRVYLQHATIPADALQRQLLLERPAVATGVAGDELVLNPQCLTVAEVRPLLAAIAAAVRSLSATIPSTLYPTKGTTP